MTAGLKNGVDADVDRIVKLALKLNKKLDDGAPPPPTAQKILKILRRTEIVDRAHDVVSSAALQFAQDAYAIAETIASRDDGETLVTEHHAKQAIRTVWLKAHRVDWSDLALALGGVFLGLGLDKSWDAFAATQPTKTHMVAFGLALVGAVLLTIGTVSKVR